MKKIVISFFASLFIIFYLLFVFFSAFKFLKNKIIVNFSFGIISWLILIASFFLIFSYFYAKFSKILRDFNQVYIYVKKNKFIEFLKFLLFSFLFIIIVYLFTDFILKESKEFFLPLNILLFLIGAIIFYQLLDFFLELSIINYFDVFNLRTIIQRNEQYKLLTYKEFLVKLTEFINQSKRFNFMIGIIVLYIKPLRVMKGMYKELLTNQLNYLLLQYSRNYEPWCSYQTENIYLKLVGVNNKKDIKNVIERFYSILDSHKFYVLNEEVKMKYKIFGIAISMSFFKDKIIRTGEEFINILKENIEQIVHSEEEFKVIELNK